MKDSTDLNNLIKNHSPPSAENLPRHEGDENTASVANAMKSVGDVHQRKGNYEKAEECYVLARDAFARIGDQLGMADAVNSLGDVHMANATKNLQGTDRVCDYYAKAKECYGFVRDTHALIGNDLGMADAVKRLGDTHLMSPDPRGFLNAKQCYIFARDACAEVGYQTGMANAAKSLGDVYLTLGDYTKAKECYILVWDTFSRIRDQVGMTDAVMGIGRLHEIRGNGKEAEKFYILARDMSSRIGDQGGMASAVQILGELHETLRGDYTKAKECYILARDTYNRIGDQIGAERVEQRLQAVRDLERPRDDTHMVESHFLPWIAPSQIDGHLGMTNALQNPGDIQPMRGDDTEAEELPALDTFTQIEDQLGMANAVQSPEDIRQMRNDWTEAGTATAFIGLGAVYYSRKEHDIAEEAYIAARDIASRIDHPWTIDASARGLEAVRRSRNSPSSDMR